MARRADGSTAFGLALRSRREVVGRSQAGLAEQVGVYRQFIQRMEMSADANPTWDTIRRLAAALGCTDADLVRE